MTFTNSTPSLFDKALRPRRFPESPPRRTAPYEDEPGFYVPGQLWLYGNTRLLCGDLACVSACLACPDTFDPKSLDAIERAAEELVLSGRILVCGIHNEAHRRAAVVPLRWGAPRIVVVSGGFKHHLGDDLKEEPFRVARLWRYKWDAQTDLIMSRRSPNRLPTYANHNPTVNRVITALANRSHHGFALATDPFGPRLFE